VNMVKPRLFTLTIALVVQGLFFSVNASEDVKAIISSGTEREESLISASLSNENSHGSPFSKGGLYSSPLLVKGGAGEFGDETSQNKHARQYAERGLVDLAIPELQKTIEIYPDDLEAHAYLGWAYSQKGLIPDAVRELQKVLEMNPELQKMPFDYSMVKDIPATVKEFTTSFEDVIDAINGFSGAHELLGLCYVLQGRLGDALNEYKKVLELESCFVRKGFIANGKKAISPIDQAIREYEDVLREMPDCVEAYLKLACAHTEKGILDAAIEDIKKVISMKPDLVEARVYLGCFYAKKWMLDEAIKELGEAKQLRDRIIEKLVTEAEHFIRDCMFDKAIAVTREAMKFDSRNKKAHCLLSMAYGKKGEMDEAVKACKEIMGLYPDDIQAYTLLGWIYAQRDLFKEAMDLARQAIRIEPENADIRALMAFIYASQNQIHQAIEMCNMVNNKASGENVPADYGWVKGNVTSIEQKLREVMDVLKMKPDYSEAYLCLGWLHSKNGEPEKAITAFRKAIELMPDSYNAHLCLGNMCVQKGEIKNAITEYGKVLEILSKKAQDDIAQGLASIKKGDIGQAVDCFNEALKVDPECGEAYAFLADAYEKKGLYSVGMVLRLQGERIKQGVHN